MKMNTGATNSFQPTGVWRRLMAYLLYLAVRSGVPVVSCFTGFKKHTVGKCTIFAPPEQTQIILEGITCLQALDPEMYFRLAEERRYIFLYDKDQCQKCREVFTITDNFLLWGKEGVVVFFVQCIFEASFNPLLLGQASDPNGEPKPAMRQQIQRQVFGWLDKHSRFLPSELVAQYREMTTET